MPHPVGGAVGVTLSHAGIHPRAGLKSHLIKMNFNDILGRGSHLSTENTKATIIITVSVHTYVHKLSQLRYYGYILTIH